MFCIKCKRPITRSYGAPYLAGNYCEACAPKQSDLNIICAAIVKAFAAVAARPIRVGDIIKVQDCHHSEPHCYEVSDIENGEYVSQPAHFKHSFNDVIAVYRFDGKDYKCIWEKNDND